MPTSQFILLKQTPAGDMALLTGELEPMTAREAKRISEKYILNTLAVGGTPEPIYQFEVAGKPKVINASTIAAEEA